MAQEYSPEQQQIRSNCFRWRNNTINLIIEEKWDQIESNPCPSDECTVCQNPMMGSSPLEPLFTIPSTFTPTIQATIERIYGPQTPDNWYKMLLENYPKFTNLRYFIENGLIDINNGSYAYTLFSFYAAYNRREIIPIWDYLLSEEVGFNINTQDVEGENALLTYLRSTYYDREDFNEGERQEEYMLIYNQNIIYLLEKGADILLEDKNGISALEYARNLSTFPQEQKDRLIQLLEQYQ